MLTIRQAKKELKMGIQSYLLKDINGKYILSEVNKLPFYLLGAPGIGKTQIVGQIAEELEIGFVSTSITHHSRNTVLGLPVITELSSREGECVKYTKYTMSEILADVQAKYENGEKEGILLLDEFASMAESLVAPMLAFLQTKNIGNYVLPEGWIIVLCSNPSSCNRTAREFDAAIMDRVRILNVEYSANEFIAYGKEKNIHKTILEYLNIHKNHIYICTGGKGEIVTTRGWENLSYCIYIYEQMNIEVTKDLITQYIKSVEVAHSFYSFYITVGKKLPEGIVSEILTGINVKRNLMILADVDLATKWGVLNQFIYKMTEEAKVYKEGYSRYLCLEATYKYLSERHEKVSDAWDFYDVICKRATGTQSFNDKMEKEVFGEVNVSEEEQLIYKKLLDVIDNQQIGDNVEKMIHFDDTTKAYTNEMIIKAMREFVADLQNELIEEMSGTNDKITNIIVFLDRMGSSEESFVDVFVEKLSQESSLLDLLLLCQNSVYSKAVMDANNALGRGLRKVTS